MANRTERNRQANDSRFNAGFIQEAIIKDNRDPTGTGRLKVWVKGSSSQEDSPSGWIIAEYAPPFAGNTRGVSNAKSYQDHPKSYGFWAVPPDVGSVVYVFFVGGNIHQARWFCCGLDFGMNSSIPAPQTKQLQDGKSQYPTPVVEYDRNTVTANPQNHYPNVPLIEGLTKQNLLYDAKKGVPNRSSRRQAPAMVYGMTTPRGNHIVLDDGYLDSELKAKNWDDSRDELQDTEYGNATKDTKVGNRKDEAIVLRTRSGAQLIISESDGFVYVINRDGTASIEMTADGDIFVLSKRDFVVKAERDINYHAGRDFKLEVMRDLNIKVHGSTRNEFTGSYHSTYKADLVLNSESDARIWSNATLQLKGKSALHISSPDAVNISSGSTASIEGSSAINMTGGGGNATLKSDLNVGGSVLASDVKIPGSSLSGHTHKNVQNGEGVTPPGEGGGASPSASAATSAAQADATAAEVPQEREYEDVARVQPDENTNKKVARDIDQAQTKTLSSMFAVMPASGTIDKYGYWGKDVMQPDGDADDNFGWTIMGSGQVVAMFGGYVINRTTNTVQVDHGNGFQSLYKGIKVDDSIQDGVDVTTAQLLGTYTGAFLFEVRGTKAPIYGMTGTVDPGRFYVEETGIGSECAGKRLVQGKKSKSTTEVQLDAQGSTVLVSKVKGTTILSSITLSGSLNIPSNRNVAVQEYVSATAKRGRRGNVVSQDLVAVGSSTPEGWVVKATDKDLIDDLIADEGTMDYQRMQGYVRNNMFHVYVDSEGYNTIGYGHLLKGGESFFGGIDEPTARRMLEKDVSVAVEGASNSIFREYGMMLPRIVQIVLTQMVFQLGLPKTRRFVKFIAALQAQDYETAALELQDSDWYRQTGARVRKHMARLRSVKN